MNLPMIALLACKALEMINVAACTHNHLKRGNNLVACCAVPSISKKPVITITNYLLLPIYNNDDFFKI